MRGRTVLALSTLALAALSFPSGAQAQEPPPESASVSPAPKPDFVDDMIRLWKANLSEDFIKGYVSNTSTARDLSAEDVIRLRSAGVPESLITYVATHPTGGVERRSPVAAPGPAAVRRWDGLVRRNSGVVLKSRWDPGTLEFKDGALRWTDAKDTAKNVLVPVEQMKEQQLTCLKKAGGNECFEWVVKTRKEEYRFRDVAWQQGRNETVAQVFEFFRGAYPSLIASQNPVDEK